MVIPKLETVEQFVAWEEQQDEKFEFSDGEISLFPGGTHRHSSIGVNIVLAMRLHGLAPGAVLHEPKTLMARSSRYPDIAVTFDPRELPENTALRYPVLLVEVLSPSTESVDRGAKLDEYRSIETLQEYILVDSRKRWAQTFRRIADRWIVSLPIVDGTLEMVSVGVTMTFEELYAGTGL